MLVKKCGLDAVKAVMPEEHMKLLTNIRKVWQIIYDFETLIEMYKCICYSILLSYIIHPLLYADQGAEREETFSKL